MITTPLQKACFALLCLFVFTGINAQSNFKPGYVVTLMGDTLKGDIDNRSEKYNTLVCDFRNANSDATTSYHPDELKSYHIENGKYYVSYNRYDEVKDKVFLEYVYEGDLSIFYYTKDAEEHYFVAKDTTFVELIHKNVINGLAKKSERYKIQLRYLLKDHPAILDKIDRTKCYKSDLTDLAKAYQKLSSPSEAGKQFNSPRNKTITVNYGAYIAAGPSTIKTAERQIGSSDYNVDANLDFDKTVTYEVGAIVNFNLNFIGENKYAVLFTPSLNIAEYESDKERTLSPLRYIYKANVKFVTLKLPLSFKYSFYSSEWPVIPYFKLGGGAALYLSQKGEYNYRSTPLNNSSPSNDNVYNESLDSKGTTLKAILSAGAGIDFKTGKNLFTLGVNIEHGDTQFTGTRTDFMLQAGFIFK
ncbi:hypothetical protein [Flavobacterium rhizosphaerae]|uniref:Outer membrane beta-barrel protein n=1 Tax=Flavobacterium rhizosphaerae TaxID=3163298 RepID=A0ABW8YWI5_9FLAO